MFEKPDVQAQVWKSQRTIHGLAIVNSWRLLESCRVHIIAFTSTQMILLGEDDIHFQEAEYCGVTNAIAETCWLRNLLREFHTPMSFVTLVYYDNVSAVYLYSNLVQHQHQRTKHIKINIHFVRDLVAGDQGILNDNTDIHDKEPSIFIHDKPDAPKEILVEDEPQKAKEHIVQPSIEALAQMPKYAKFLKTLLTNKARLEETCSVTINERETVLATARAMIDVFNEKITLRVGDDEVIFNVDQSIERPPAEDDELYDIDDLNETINVETHELLGND
nr:ribonuclease H-like domain-containing protein [Tanacetum cinerariifolium]